jgi:hypothetical protein
LRRNKERATQRIATFLTKIIRILRKIDAEIAKTRIRNNLKATKESEPLNFSPRFTRYAKGRLCEKTSGFANMYWIPSGICLA